NVYFVQLITEEMDLSEVVSVFNTINTTGLDLNATDIFKVRYYNYLRGIDNTKDWLKEINSCYQSIDDSNEKLGKDGRTDQTKFDMGWVLDIYKHIICAEFGWGFSEVSKSNQKFFDELFKGTRLTEQSDLSVLEFDTFKHIVDGFIDYWRWIENVRYNGEHPEIAKEIFSIYLVEKTRYKRYWTIPFVVAYFRAKAEVKGWSNYYIDSLRVNMYMFRFFLIYTVVNDRVINYVQNKVCDKCFKWFKECNTDKIIENIGKELLSPVLDEDDKIWKKFYGIIESGLFDNGSRVHLVCTLTALIDEVKNKGVKERDIYEKFFNYEMIKDPYDIEHIEARNNFKDDKDNVDEFNGIGNLMVLERSINRGIKDKPVGGKGGKTEEYEKSKYAAVKIEFLDKYRNLDKWDIERVRDRATEEIEKIKSFMKEE
uniref:GmrSD restriction endonuclease domain-containing protein n=1 Tax=Lachnoanaerobaculum orale TaxID=979627 RepID=UPI0023A7FC55